MKIKEKLKNLANSWKIHAMSGKLRTTLGNTAIVTKGQAVWQICQENPFPVQCLLILLYRLSLDFVYVTQLSPLYAYSGFTTAIVPIRYLLSLAAVMVYLPFIAKINEEENASSTVVTFLNYLYFIPFTSYCGCKGVDLGFFLAGFIYWGILLLLQMRLPSVQFKAMNYRNIQRIFLLLTIFSVLFVMFISGRYTGFRFTLDVQNVYDIRAESAGYNIPGIFQYLLSFMSVILSMLILHYLQRKKYIGVVVLIIVFLFYYSISAHKTNFFFLLLVLGAYILYRRWMLRWVSGILMIGVGVAWMMQEAAGFLYPMAVFVRRLMYIPAQLAESCYEFFQENPLNLFRWGIMGNLGFDNIYSIPIPLVIGEFEGNPESFANTGILGDVYANLPVLLGIFIMPLILVIVFRLMDASTKGLAPRVFVSICLYNAIGFMNGSWSIVLLSHGFLLTCILLYIFPKKEDSLIL